LSAAAVDAPTTLARMTIISRPDKLHETSFLEKTVSQLSELKESGIPIIRTHD
jgi:hypothetical protein